MRWKPGIGSIFVFFAGSAFFLIVLLRQNSGEILKTFLGRIGPLAIATLVLMRLAFWLLRTWCWRLVLTPLVFAKPRFFDLFANRLAGFAVGTFVPGGKLLAVPIRVALSNKLPKDALTISIIVDKFLEWSAGFFGIIIALVLFTMRTKRIFHAGKIAAGLVVGLSLLFVLLTVWFRKTGFTALGVFLVRIFRSKPRVMQIVDFCRNASDHLDFLLRDCSPRLYTVLVFYILLICWWALELYATLLFLGGSVGYPTTFLIVTLGSVSMILPVTPGNIGVYEGTYMALFLLLSVPASLGIACILLRRGLSLLFSGLGIGLSIRFFRQRTKQTDELQGNADGHDQTHHGQDQVEPVKK